MKRVRLTRWCSVLLGHAVIMLLCPAAFTQGLIAPKPPGEEMEVEEFRQALILFTGFAGAAMQSSDTLPYRIAELSGEEMQAVYDAFPNPRTFSTLVGRMKERFEASRGAVQDQANERAFLRETTIPSFAKSDGEVESQTGGTVAGIIGILAPCESFSPNYPSSGLLDFLTSLGLANVSEDERCSDDDVEIFVVAKIAAEVAAIVAQAACDHITVILGEGSNAPFCVAAGIANGVKAAAQVVLDACQELTRQVDSAEIQAAFENTKIIIDGLCCVPVAQPRKHHGCNGEDDNCDGVIDDCAEDLFGPDVFVDPSVQGACFKDVAEAEAALAAATNAVDDCGSVGPININLSGTECDVDADISVADDCANTTVLTGAASFRIDGEPPTVTCDVATTVMFPPNLSYTNVGFTFTASDNCTGDEDLLIEVKVTSDEQTTLPPGRGHASPFPDAAVLRTLDGAIDGVLLRNERGMLSNGRVYMIHVFATDECGNVGSATCTVVVPAADGFTAIDDGQYFDATGIN